MYRKEHLSELLGYCHTQGLTPSAASMLLLALAQCPEAKSECISLAVKISGNGAGWVKTGKLSTVLLRLLALQNYDKAKITGSMLALLGKRLIEAEVRVGGPYHTLVDDDIELNALTAQLFESLGSPLSSLNSYLREAIRANPTYLSTDLGVWSIVTPVKLELGLEIPKNKVAYASLRQRVATISLSSSSQHVHTEPVYKPGETITMFIKSEIKTMPSTIRPVALRLWKTVANIDQRYEITCLSRYFALSTKEPVRAFSDDDLRDLGVANFYAWVAYTIYDDFIDGEGDEALLSTANIFHRLSLFKYLKLANQDFVKKFYDDVDLANSYELSNYRAGVHGDFIELTHIPEYGDGEFLAQRSRGHVLGPILLASHIENSLAHQQQLIRQALDHYLIARQLNDDAHDWIEDLQNGQISFVVSHLLTSTGIKPGRHRIKDLAKILRTYFWKQGLYEISSLTIAHATLAKNCLEDSNLIHKNSLFVKNCIEPIIESAKNAAHQLDEQKEFAKTYSR